MRCGAACGFLFAWAACTPVEPLAPILTPRTETEPGVSVVSSPRALPKPAASVFPTLANAGGETCELLAPRVLGPRDGNSTVVGFVGSQGVVVWRRDASSLAIQPIASDGGNVGTTASVPLSAGLEPVYVYAVDAGFVVLLLLWDYKRGVTSWSALVVGADGGVGPIASIGLDDMAVDVGQSLGGDRVGLLVSPAIIAKSKEPPRWQTVVIGPGGKVTATATAVDVEGLLTPGVDVWEPAELDAQRGWVTLRDGNRGPEGVFEGQRKAAAGAVVLRPPDSIHAQVFNAAVPPGRGAGGTIREAAGRPMLERTRQGARIGRATALEWDGTPVGSHSMNIESLLVWSGTHFIYPFHDERGANLMAIDCSP